MVTVDRCCKGPRRFHVPLLRGAVESGAALVVDSLDSRREVVAPDQHREVRGVAVGGGGVEWRATVPVSDTWT